MKDALVFPAVTALLKEGVGGRLLIAVNSSSRAVTARFDIGEKVLEEKFGPLGVRLVKMEIER